VDGRHLQSLGRLEIGQQGGQPFGEHGLAGTRRSGQEKVMTARGRNLQCQPRFFLSNNVT